MSENLASSLYVSLLSISQPSSHDREPHLLKAWLGFPPFGCCGPVEGVARVPRGWWSCPPFQSLTKRSFCLGEWMSKFFKKNIPSFNGASSFLSYTETKSVARTEIRRGVFFKGLSRMLLTEPAMSIPSTMWPESGIFSPLGVSSQDPLRIPGKCYFSIHHPWKALFSSSTIKGCYWAP